MFPQSSEDTAEEEIRWTIEGLRETLQTRSAGFRKVCLADGTPVGFAGWSLEQTTGESSTSDSGDDLKERKQRNNHPRPNYWHPSTLDVKSWVDVSKIFRKERERVLENYKDIWRTFSCEDSLL
ncbi:hypothetical protein DTO271G3_2952 [Paecilomyces variotii]|nr:hypothetical protein DTO271G3_2952 [Paecilomyces variotii]